MRQPLSSLTRWVVAGVLAGLETAAIAHGFLDVNGQFSTIDFPGADYTRATGINDAGQIVGAFYDPHDPGIPHGFLDAGGTFSTIDVPGADYTSAHGINDAGEIVGEFIGGGLVPEPGSLVLFSVGMLGLALACWHRRRLRGVVGLKG